MSLTSLKVKDFQSIENAEVEFGKFTVFTGPSSSGKSAFLRAAKALARNTFNPSQVRMGSKETVVSMEVNGRVVTAVRGKSKSTYRLDDEEYTKAGRTVPEDIEKVLSMPLVADLDATFSTQFDKPFLISEPGSVGAKVLGELTNVGVLHSGVREANRRTLEVRSNLKVKEQDLADCISSLSEFEDLDSSLESLQIIEKLLSNTEEARSQINVLTELLGSVDSFHEELSRAKENIVDLSELESGLGDLANSESKLVVLDRVIADIKTKGSQLPDWDFSSVPDIGNLSEDISRLETLDRLVSRLEEMQSTLPDWDYTQVPDTTSTDEECLEDYLKLSSLIASLQTKVVDLKNMSATLEEAETKTRRVEEELNNFLPDTCPLCGNGTKRHEH